MFHIYLFGPAHAKLGYESFTTNNFLMQDSTSFPLLTHLSPYDECFFSSDDMVDLESELLRIRKTIAGDHAEHVDRLIALARVCAGCEGSYLLFTPFGPLTHDRYERR